MKGLPNFQIFKFSPKESFRQTSNYIAPSCFRYFSELALVASGGFNARDFLKLVIAFFLDIRTKIDNRGNEEGLLGLAFHPDFQTNGFFYVNYTATNPDRTVVSRFQVSSNINQADPDSEQLIITFAQPYENHNGGQISFGPDGYLYVAAGDGGSGGDPQGNGQNRAALLGKWIVGRNPISISMLLFVDVNAKDFPK